MIFVTDKIDAHPQDASAAGLSVPVFRLGIMADSRLSVHDRELFLAEPHIAALSVSAGRDRGPLTVPIWYQYVPGGEAWVLTGARSRKTRLIEAAGRFTLMVERTMPTVRYVSVEGPVTRVIPATDELLREITERYLPPDEVPAYIELATTEFGDQVVIYLRPQRWLTADLGPGSMPPNSLRRKPSTRRAVNLPTRGPRGSPAGPRAAVPSGRRHRPRPAWPGGPGQVADARFGVRFSLCLPLSTRWRRLPCRS
jgi:hypothetical protein